jgi:glycosyltransferase involved in cell wall biosynthesis
MKLPEKFILYLGNFKPHKNVNALIEAYKKIENKFPEHKLVLAGPLDDHGIKTQDYVSRLGLTTKILFTDTVRESDYPEAIITMADLFVFPSLYEGFGLPPLEAMACGTPVLASNLTSVPEVVADAGVLVNPKNIEDLANGMLNILKSSETRAIYSNKGLERAKKFREKYSAGKLYNHIISLLEEVK